MVANGDANLEAWQNLADDEMRARLCDLPGVGVKVANCVMLFAYERLRAFPVDVWIERVLREQYFPRKRKVSARQLREFCDNYFGEHGGYAQQYLFHHARTGRQCPNARNPFYLFTAQEDRWSYQGQRSCKAGRTSVVEPPPGGVRGLGATGGWPARAGRTPGSGATGGWPAR